MHLLPVFLCVCVTCVRYLSLSLSLSLSRSLSLSLYVILVCVTCVRYLCVSVCRCGCCVCRCVLCVCCVCVVCVENSVPKWGAEPSLAGQWLPVSGGDGAWAARTVSGPVLMRGDIFAASRGGGSGC